MHFDYEQTKYNNWTAKFFGEDIGFIVDRRPELSYEGELVDSRYEALYTHDGKSRDPLHFITRRGAEMYLREMHEGNMQKEWGISPVRSHVSG